MRYYREYCETEQAWVRVETEDVLEDEVPCPNDPGHEVRDGTLVFIREVVE